MKRAVFASLLLTGSAVGQPYFPSMIVARAHAEEPQPTLGQRVDDTKDAVSNAAQEAAQRAQDHANEAAESARDRASEVADQAREHASQAAESLSERAKDVAAHAEELAGQLMENAKAQAGQLGERAGVLLARGKSRAGDAMQNARDQARDILISAAVALDNKTRDAREAARLASWEKLKARFHLLSNRPSLALSEELRDHEYRVARLRRARDLATAVKDQPSVAQANLLMELEYGRFKRRVEEIHAREVEESQR